MENYYNNLVSFFAIWFNDFKKSVFKVQVVNKDNTNPVVEKKLSEIVEAIKKELSKTHLVAVTNQKSVDTSALEKKISELMGAVKSFKPQDLTKVEKLLVDLIGSVKDIPQPQVPTIKIPETKFPDTIDVKNFPKTQNIKGQVEVDFKGVIDGLQVVVDAINDLKVDMSHEMKGMTQVYAGQTGGRTTVKITDGTDEATITPIGDSNALDVNIAGGSLDQALMVDPASATVTYVGYAALGTETSDALWKIKKIDTTSGVAITWADGDNSYNNVWDNRAALSYD